MPRPLTLALFYRPERIATRDMMAIAAEIRRLDPGLRPRVLSTDEVHGREGWNPFRRAAVSIEFHSPKPFPLRRAVRLRQLPPSKLAPSDVIRDAGLPIPPYAVLTPGIRLDPAEWGPYVVVKPDRGRRGAYVRMQRTDRARFRTPEELEEDDPGRRGQRFAQRFIHTGRFPVSYRVLTLFGEPLICTRYDGREHGAPLDSPEDFGRSGYRSIVASAKGSTIRLWHDEEMLALARRVHALFPTVPLLGQDFIRDKDSGRLYVVEVNPSGAVWSFSNRSGREMQAQFGFDFYTQFGGMRTAARRLVEVARQYAP